jgi:two-component system sensor histidine kinase PilS (NtrC family)
MSGSIELLQTGALLPDKDRKLMRIVHREVERLDALVRDFLSFAKPIAPELRPVDLSRLVEELGTVLQPSLKPRGLSLTVEMPSGVWVQADEGQLKQVLWNLLGNAADATSGGGQVRVQVWREDEKVLVVVEDSGAGIAPEDLPRIFDPFFTTKERGTGLGLAIVHRIVEAHGGLLEVSSEVGRGSAFKITLAASVAGAGRSDPELPVAPLAS